MMGRSLLLGVFAIFLLCGIATASSISDPTGDVAHWKIQGLSGSWEYNIANKPNIDITGISYIINGNKLIITLTVAGAIESSELVKYWAYLNTSDAHYWMFWNNGEGGGFSLGESGFSGFFNQTPDVQASGNTLSGTFEIVGSNYSNIELWGGSAEYLSPGDTFHEWWGDWVPNEYAPWWGEDTSGSQTGNGEESESNNTGGENNQNSNPSDNLPSERTPGFEMLTVILAVTLLIIAKKRKF